MLNKMNMDSRFPVANIGPAIQNLQLPEYSGIRDVFGKVLALRSKPPELGCSLFNLLASRVHTLTALNRDCAVYVREIGLSEAQRKCDSDVLGKARRPALEFNGSCADFWAEIAAIRTLLEKGYSRFRAIHRKQPDGTTSDYEAFFDDLPAHIEVKNMRSNRTVTDVFHDALRLLSHSEPAEFPFNVQVTFPSDDPPNGEQERTIRQYVAKMRGRKPPFREQILLGDAEARINVIEGSGTAMMVRGMGLDSPEPLNKERFLRRIADKAVEAAAQMKDDKRLKVLVINFDSPSGSIAGDFVIDAEETIKTVFNGNVRPYVLLYRNLVELES